MSLLTDYKSAFVFGSVPWSVLATTGLIAGISLERFGPAPFSLFWPLIVGCAGIVTIRFYGKFIVAPFLIHCCIGSSIYMVHDQLLRGIAPTKIISGPFVVNSVIHTGNPQWPFATKIVSINRSYNLLGQNLLVYTKRRPQVQCGDLVEYPSIELKAPAQKEFKLFLQKEGIQGTLFKYTFKSILLKRPRFSISAFLDQKREALFAACKGKMSPDTFALFSSLFMGDKMRVKGRIEPYKGPFKYWGISHQLARSGLHLMLFIVLWHFMISLIPGNFFIKTGSLLLLSFVYLALTPATVSFMRAFHVFALYKLCALFEKQIHSVHIICLVCYGTLFSNPFQLFFLDFQLSFFLTFCLAWLAHIARTRKVLAPDVAF